ncbi:MAG: hypothetical protein LBQ98_07890 [Nitrososphaerota archaeon]|jgi:hypothetical protein|nr:hypothetical protein [Nitrososphaerota archaeon]
MIVEGLGGNRMVFVEIMIGKKLTDVDPALDIMGSDYKVLQIACQDFTNYLKFRWNLMGQNVNHLEIDAMLESFSKENSEELDVFLAIWCNTWFKKWKERVKLLIGNQSADRSTLLANPDRVVEPLWQDIECKQELGELIVATLIKNGEICGTEIIAENLLKLELGKPYLQNLNETQQIFVALNNTLRKARGMAQSRGPLIFVKVDKGYYDIVE